LVVEGTQFQEPTMELSQGILAKDGLGFRGNP